jgi:hypothetical protein
MTQGVFTIAQQLQGQIRKTWGGSISTPAVEYLVVAGGGGSAGTGGGSAGGGGGGGAGGLLTGIVPITAGTSYTVTVGTGGAAGAQQANGSQGTNSVFSSITSIGGGGGGAGTSGAGGNGGSGGGGNGSNASGVVLMGGTGIFGQGNAGGNGAKCGDEGSGGGGAGTIGLPGINTVRTGNGGAGIASSISGTVTTYAGGGGGGGNDTDVGGVGGVGGGGSRPTGTQATGGAGTANTGGGGGGGYATSANQAGGAGGSGIVIISYPDTYNAPTSFGGANSPTASTSGSGSVIFSGTSNQSATYSTSNLGTGNFTVECWFYNTDLVNEPIFSIGTYLTGIDVRIAESAANKLDFYFYNVIKSGSFTSTNTWQHLAIVRNSGTTTVYVNGAVFITAFSDTNSYVGSTRVGSFQAGGATHTSFAGNISNFRLTNTAVYTTTFTPSTAPLTAVSGTQLLLNTVSPSGFNDSSTNAYTPTLVSTPTWNQASPFATGLGYKNRVYTWTGSGTVTF